MNVIAKIKKDTKNALIKNREQRTVSIAALEEKLSDSVEKNDFDVAYALAAGIEALKQYGRTRSSAR